VARSHLVARLSKSARPRGSYRKSEDAALLPTLRPIVDARPTYGYRRVTALVNRLLRSRGEPVVNAKPVLRILRMNELTLAAQTRMPHALRESSDRVNALAATAASRRNGAGDNAKIQIAAT